MRSKKEGLDRLDQEARAPSDPASVQVLNDVLELFNAPETSPETGQQLRLWSRLNEAVHKMLLAGLFASTAALLAGLTISAITHQPVPSSVSGFAGMVEGLRQGSPAGFLSLGILLLIATPVLRILGSLAEFIANRDWRYACITLLVLAVLGASLLAGIA